MNLSEKELLVGPILRKKNRHVYQKKWTNELNEWQRIVDELNKIEGTEVQQKKDELENKIALSEGDFITMKETNGQHIISLFEQWAPKSLAVEGDPVGLQIGTSK